MTNISENNKPRALVNIIGHPAIIFIVFQGGWIFNTFIYIVIAEFYLIVIHSYQDEKTFYTLLTASQGSNASLLLTPSIHFNNFSQNVHPLLIEPGEYETKLTFRLSRS